jgi:predicted TIM-barrel fold metal-dependent hydrolase
MAEPGRHSSVDELRGAQTSTTTGSCALVTAPVEEILDPALEIVDAHHHLWPAHGPAASADVTANEARPWSSYSFEHFLRDAAAGHRVTGSVYVECQARYRTEGPESLRPIGETEAVARLEPHGGLCAAMVAFADLSLGAAVGEVLDAHLAVPGSRVRGIRHIAAWDPDPTVYATARRPPGGLLQDPRFLAGVAELAPRGLRFETWVYFHQLPELARFADAHPELPIVLDHLGGPAATGGYASARAEVLEAWRAGMATVSRRPNVTVKLGAVGMRAFSGAELFTDPAPSSEDIANYWGDDIRFCIETFGPDRCMFQSNYPVDRALCDYATLWNAYKRIGAQYSDSEKALLFAETARAAYGLPVNEQ